MKAWLFTHRWFLLIVLVALLLRLVYITNTVGDWHAFRQSDTASVNREYLKQGIDLFRPQYLDLSNIQSGFENTEGWRMVEFPWANALTAVIILITSGDEVIVARLVSVCFSLLALVALFVLVKRVADERLALISALVMAVLPYSVFYSRAVLPEAAMLGTSMLALMAFELWHDKRQWYWLVLTSVALALAMLVKPFVVFTGLVFVSIAWYRRGWRGVIHWSNILIAAVAIAPFWWWRQWIEQFPSGIPVNKWLWNGDEIRWRPAWFRWLFWERLTLLIGGGVGAILGALNIFSWRRKVNVIWVAWWIGILVYFSAIATGNVRHDYYQTLVIPIISISIAQGLLVMYDWLAQRFNDRVAGIASGVVTTIMVLVAWQYIKGYYNINHPEYVVAGKAVDRLVPADAKVIAPAFGDTQFLFQTNRRGWPIGFEIEKKRAMGATHYVSTSYDDEVRMLEKQYQTLEKNSLYTIIDLTTPLSTESAISP